MACTFTYHGIYPCKPLIFADKVFVPAQVTKITEKEETKRTVVEEDPDAVFQHKTESNTIESQSGLQLHLL